MGAGGERARALCWCVPGGYDGTAPLTIVNLTSGQTVRLPLHAGAMLSSDALCWPCTPGSFAAVAGEFPSGEEWHSRIMVKQFII